MFSRKVAAITALSLLLATSPSIAQTDKPSAPPPPAKVDNPITNQDRLTQSGLLLMLAAIAGAVLLTVLATQLGDNEPASP